MMEAAGITLMVLGASPFLAGVFSRRMRRDRHVWPFFLGVALFITGMALLAHSPAGQQEIGLGLS
jgi:drug/metabolite transporter (DMT)-like permease